MSKMRTLVITLWFHEKCLSRFFIFEKQLASQKYVCCKIIQPYSHNRFSKMLRTFCANRNSWVSCVSLWIKTNTNSCTYLVYDTVVRLCQFFCCGRQANLVQLTLFYSTLFTFTDRRMDGRRNKLILDGLGNQKKLVPPG